MRDSFKDFAASPEHKNWNQMISRNHVLYRRHNDIRNEFERDYTRIINSTAYRRLKHKTQVFFSPESDHVCTRSEHVTHVESISHTIAKYLGLNTDLTKAISVAHDIGHSPFGHQGEKELSKISMRDNSTPFWHEKNGLNVVDNIEILENHNREFQNLNLTYAVRDGIISHCGEIDENSLFPRKEAIDLNAYTYPNQYAPYTWEGCVVKISDKISYIGRDIMDAFSLRILNNHTEELDDILELPDGTKINNSIIINYLINDLCENSSPEKGLAFSDEGFEILNKIKKFNYDYIYLSKKLEPSTRYFSLVINEIYNTLYNEYSEDKTYENLKNIEKFYPKLIKGFLKWLTEYLKPIDCNKIFIENYTGNYPLNYYKNSKLFDISNKIDYSYAILYFIAGMTDNFAIETYNEIIGF